MWSLECCITILLCTTSAVECAAYDGQECTGALSFTVNVSSAEQAALDLYVQGNLSEYPVWIEERCHAALRTYYCIDIYDSYATTDGNQWCMDACVSALSQCKRFITYFDTSETYEEWTEGLCGNATSSCQDQAIVTADTELDSPTCPPTLTLRLYGAAHFVYSIDGTGCAIPCPQIVWTSFEWNSMRLVFLVLSSVAFICSMLTFLGTMLSNKHHMVKKFSFGFVASSTSMFLFLAIGENDKLTCAGSEQYTRRSVGCLLQATVSLYGFLFVQCCALCQSYHLYLLIVEQATAFYLQKIQRYYTFFCCGFPMLVTVIPLSANNLGFDQNVAIPFCFFLFSDNSAYFWTLFSVPMTIMTVLCSFLLVHVAYTLTRTMRHFNGRTLSVQLPDAVTTAEGILTRYNRHTLTFIFVYCLSTAFVAIAIVYVFGIRYDRYYQSAQDWVKCSLRTGQSPTTKDAIFDACGEHPTKRSPIFLFLPIVFYVGAYGIIPFLIHGPAGLLAYMKLEAAPRKQRNIIDVALSEPLNISDSEELFRSNGTLAHHAQDDTRPPFSDHQLWSTEVQHSANASLPATSASFWGKWRETSDSELVRLSQG